MRHLPAAMGMSPPVESGINGKDVMSAMAFEKRIMTRTQLVAELDKSFAFRIASMSGVSETQLNAPLTFFGEKTASRSVWIMTATHLHEHLGQLIAYARSNKVTPPWST